MENFTEGKRLLEIKEIKKDIAIVWMKLENFLNNDESSFPVKSNRQKQRIIQVIHFIRANGGSCTDLRDVPKKPFNNAEDLKIAKLRLRKFEAEPCISAFKVLKNGLQVLKDINRFTKKPAKTLEFNLSKSSVIEFHKILCNFIHDMEKKCSILQTHVDFYPLYNKITHWKDMLLDQVQKHDVEITTQHTTISTNLNMLEGYISSMQDFKLRNQTRLLIYRCRVLCDFMECMGNKIVGYAGLDLQEFCLVELHRKHKKHNTMHNKSTSSNNSSNTVSERDDLINTDTSIHRSNSKSAYNVLSMEGADEYYFSSATVSRNNSYVPITPKSHNSRSMTNDHDIIEEVAVVMKKQSEVEQAPVFSPTELHLPESYFLTNGHKKRPSKKKERRKSNEIKYFSDTPKSAPKTPTEISDPLKSYTSSGTSTPTDLGLSDNETPTQKPDVVEKQDENNNKSQNDDNIDVKSLIYKFSPPVTTDTLNRDKTNKNITNHITVPKQSTPSNADKSHTDNEISVTPIPTPKPRSRDSLTEPSSTLPRVKKSRNANNNNRKSLPVFSPHPNKIPRPVPRIINDPVRLNFNNIPEDKEIILKTNKISENVATKKRSLSASTYSNETFSNEINEIDNTKPKPELEKDAKIETNEKKIPIESVDDKTKSPAIQAESPKQTTKETVFKSPVVQSSTPSIIINEKQSPVTTPDSIHDPPSTNITALSAITPPSSPSVTTPDTIPIVTQDPHPPTITRPVSPKIPPPESPHIHPPSPPMTMTNGLHHKKEAEELEIEMTDSVPSSPSSRISEYAQPMYNDTSFDIGFSISDYDPPIIIDNGSGYCKAGYATDQAPRVVCPTYIGRPKHQTQFTLANTHPDKCYVGSTANGKRGVLNLTYPIEHGIVTNWDDMEKVWHHVFENELRCEPDDHPILLTEAALNPKQNRERITQIMFEQFQVPAMYMAVQAVLALYGHGLTTGLVLDSGDGVTHVVPVYEGYSLPYGVQRSEIAGRDLSEYFTTLLQQNGHSFVSSAEREIVRDIKEQLCYVAYDVDQEDKLCHTQVEKSYTMPDGQEIMVEKERFLCPEPLFDPSILGKNPEDGVHQLLWRSLMRLDDDLKQELLSGVLLSGGTTMFPGMKKRLMKELQPIVPNLFKKKIRIHEAESPKTLVWRGGAVLANSTVTSWLSSFEYDEFGPSIIHRKAF